MRDNLGAPWHYEPKSRRVIDAEGYVLATLTGHGMERARAMSSLARQYCSTYCRSSPRDGYRARRPHNVQQH